MNKKSSPQPINVAVNGFGRIGKAVTRILLERQSPHLNLAAINDHSNSKKLAEALELDTSYGIFSMPVSHKTDQLKVNGHTIKTFMQDDPAKLPWRREKIDVVVESTGAFTHADEAKRHLRAGAKQVVISAYPSGGQAHIVVAGASDLSNTGQKMLSHASCTATCVSPVMKVLKKKFPIETSSLLAVESVTHSSQTVDKTSGRGRRRRSAMVNIIPIEVEADKAVPKIVPGMNKNFMAQGLRVPTPVVHLAVLNIVFKKSVAAKQINDLFIEVAGEGGEAEGIIGVTDKPVVSQDLKQRPESAVIDLEMTKTAGRLVQIFAWYDNEWAFSGRIVDLLEQIAINNGTN